MAGKPIPAHIHLLMAVITGFVGFAILLGLTATRDEADSPPISPSRPNVARIENPWQVEKERPKSAALQAYEDAAEPVDQKLSVANIIEECGIQDNEWYAAAVGRLEEYRAGPVIGPVFSQLTQSEKEQGRRFDKIVVDEMRKFHVGRDPIEVACRKIAVMPFPYRAEAVSP